MVNVFSYWFKPENIEEAYWVFDGKLNGVIKIAVEP